MSIEVFILSLIQSWEHTLILSSLHSFFYHQLNSHQDLLSPSSHSIKLTLKDLFYSLLSKVISLCNWVCPQRSELNKTALSHYMSKQYKLEIRKTLSCNSLQKNNCILKVVKQAWPVLWSQSWLWAVFNSNSQIQTYEFQKCLNSLFRHAHNVLTYQHN